MSARFSRWWEAVVARTTRVGDRVLRFVDRLIARSSILPNQPFFDPAVMPEVTSLERNWKTIRRELDTVLADRDGIPNFQDISTDQLSLTDDDRWKTYFFFGYGFKADANCARCPETTRLLEQIPGMKTAMFSILSPRKNIPPHTGPYKGVVRYHLGLLVPDPPDAVRIRVGDEWAHWEEGRSLLFDDTFEHEVRNDTDGTRVVLFVDVVRPLRQPMKAVNAAIIAVIGLSPFVQDARRRQEAWERRMDGPTAVPPGRLRP